MKYLIFILLIIFGSATLAAQDTLYVKGERKPLIVEIKIIKKKSLNYIDVESGRLKSIALKKVRKIRFEEEIEKETQYKNQKVLTSVDKGEFRSTILTQLSGLLSQNQLGINYMHRINSTFTDKVSFWIQTGGGYHVQRTFRRNAEGYYLEFGGRLELASKRNPENRFHIGLDINNQWSKGTSSPDGVFFFNGRPTELVEDSRVAFQIPVGYTYRSRNGFYLSTGLEISTHKFFPALIFRTGYAFGN